MGDMKGESENHGEMGLSTDLVRVVTIVVSLYVRLPCHVHKTSGFEQSFSPQCWHLEL